MTTTWDVGTVRARLRLGSGLIMLAFVVMHLTAHVVLLISFDWADATLALLMTPWRTTAGTALLAAAFLTHYANALWSIYVRRSLRMPRWELWQLALGLSIPLLLARHVVASRVSELALGTSTTYSTIMLTFWHSRPWLGILQVLALIVIWLHASIGIHFWLRTKPGIATGSLHSALSPCCCRRWRSPDSSPPAIRRCAKRRARITSGRRASAPTARRRRRRRSIT
jgi:hypothetical protein